MFPRTQPQRNNAKRCGLYWGVSANSTRSATMRSVAVYIGVFPRTPPAAQQCEALLFKNRCFRELHPQRNNAKRCGLKIDVSANSTRSATMRSVAILKYMFPRTPPAAQQCEALRFENICFRELHPQRNNAKRCGLYWGASANSIRSATMQSVVFHNTSDCVYIYVYKCTFNMLHIIIPFRATTQPERQQQLEILLGCFQLHLPEAHVVVVEQSCERKFNKGALQNIGFLLSGGTDTDTICLQDVDMLPDAKLILEYTRGLDVRTVRHISGSNNRYTKHKKTSERDLKNRFLGGIVMLTASAFKHVNGYPNDFWGWGGEDDELRDRLVLDGLKVEKSFVGEIKDLENNLLGRTRNQKMKNLKRTGQKCIEKRELRRWHRQHPSQQGLAQVLWKTVKMFKYYQNCDHYTVDII